MPTVEECQRIKDEQNNVNQRIDAAVVHIEKLGRDLEEIRSSMDDISNNLKVISETIEKFGSTVISWIPNAFKYISIGFASLVLLAIFRDQIPDLLKIWLSK